MQRYRKSFLFATLLAIVGMVAIQSPGALATTNNSPEPPTTATLTVVKQVVNDNGQDKTAADFSLTVTDGAAAASTITGDAGGTPVTVAPGSYSVTEGSYPGYTASFSEGCTGSLEAGGSATCTVTNDDYFVSTTGTLRVIKHVINDDDRGDNIASDYDISVDYFNGDGTSTESFSGSESGVDTVLYAGRYYNVREDAYEGYSATYTGDCSGTLTVGATKTCTVTNDDILSENVGKVIVKKRVVNKFGGTKVPGDFTLHIDYRSPESKETKKEEVEIAEYSPTTTDSFQGDENGTVFFVEPGYFHVYEDTQTGYNGFLEPECSGIIAGGTVVTCVVTNSDHILESSGGPGWTPGILEPYIPSGGGTGDSGSGGSTGSTPPPVVTTESGSGSMPVVTSGGSSSEAVADLCPITENDARYVTSDVAVILGHLGQTRDLAREESLNRNLTPRIADDSTDPGVLAAIRNYVNYGTQTTLRLGAGERAGTVASFHSAYGRLPVDACDWQNVMRLANTKLPQTRVQRDLSAATTFKLVYGRDPNYGNLLDAIAQSLVGYGVRPQVRDMSAERQALSAFRKTFGKTPSNSDEWDANRAMAYSGVTQRWLSSSLAMSSSRILSIDGIGSAFALLR